VVGVDFAEEALVGPAPAYGARWRADALRLPLRSSAVDVVLAADLLEHLDDDGACLGEVCRVLRPGGHAVVLVPAFGWLWGPQDERSHHRRRYERAGLLEAVTRAGLTPQRATYLNALLLPPIALARLFLRWFRLPVRSENTITPHWADRPLRAIFEAELSWLRRWDLPWGVSLLCIARRPNSSRHDDPGAAPGSIED
jgi:SAM-dependent methyltransferase